MNRTDLVVIGGGPGGYAAAFLAADLGLKVAVVDPEANPGGVCLYRGCIPSKTLLHVMKVIDESRRAAAWGIEFKKPRVSLDRLRRFKDGVVKKLTGGLGGLAKRRGVAWLRGKARFEDANILKIRGERGGSRTLRFEHAIVATGSRPIELPDLNLDTPGVMDSNGALEMKEIPRRLLVVGGGYIGLELGMVYAALGSRVSVAEKTGGLLPGVDRDLVGVLKRRLDEAIEAILLETTVAQIKQQKNGLRVEFEGASAGRKVFDRVLLAVGRRPDTSDLGLENTRVEVDDRGFIRVDEQRRTAEPAIFAVGDVTGEPMLAHKASHEGRIAVRALSGRDAVFEPRAIPAVVFTDPEIAWCGLTETGGGGGREVRVVRFPWSASGRAATLGRSDGITKLLVDAASGRVLGVGMAGPGAGELIAEGVLALEMEADVEDIGLSIHPHPTLSETVMEAAHLFAGESAHYVRPKRKK
jgi:dihydrolipoamide dehydrogenase